MESLEAIIDQTAQSLRAALESSAASLPASQASADHPAVIAVHDAMDIALAQLARANFWGQQNQLPSSALWNHCRDILARGRLQNHARTKPHGYAGDFEMLQMICDDERFGTGIAWAFDDFFQRQSAPVAVRNRAKLVAEQLTDFAAESPKGNIRVASVGSGPATDLEQFARANPSLASRTHVRLLDLDPRALEHAQSKLESLPLAGLETARVNLKRLPRLAPAKTGLEACDFVFCAGFFDYLDHEDATKMLRFLWGTLEDHGRLLAFNFSTNNPSRAYMEWFGNWYLIHRTEQQLSQAALDAGIPESAFRVAAEPARVNLFLDARH